MTRIYFLPDITYEEVKPEIVKLYGKLVSLYYEMQIAYKDLNQTLLEIKEFKDNIDLYVPATHKLSYLSVQIPSLVDKELEIFMNDPSLIKFLEEHIKREFGLKRELNFEDFSFFDPYINPDYEVIKDNFIIMRMIRAIKYYSDYQETFLNLYKCHVTNPDKDSVRDCILYDYSDDEAINTLYVIGTTFEKEGNPEVECKFKTLFSFVNPSVERFFINTDFTETHEFIFDDGIEADKKTIKNKIIKSMFAIQRNRIINKNDKKADTIINSKLTIKQIINMLLHYDYESSPYDSIPEIIKMEYAKSYEELGLIFAYMQQAYLIIDEQSIDDLDHLFNAMTKEENNVTIGATRLHQKLVDYFVNKDEILKQRSETNRIRERHKLEEDGLDEDDDI